MMYYYDEKGFHVNQNNQGTRYEITEEERNNLIIESLNIQNEQNVNVEIVPDESGKPYIRIDEKTVEEIQDYLRWKRNWVFGIINRGNGWYNTLTDNQKKELQEWYNAWLDVTETLVEPNKPSWLK